METKNQTIDSPHLLFHYVVNSELFLCVFLDKDYSRLYRHSWIGGEIFPGRVTLRPVQDMQVLQQTLQCLQSSICISVTYGQCGVGVESVGVNIIFDIFLVIKKSMQVFRSLEFSCVEITRSFPVLVHMTLQTLRFAIICTVTSYLPWCQHINGENKVKVSVVYWIVHVCFTDIARRKKIIITLPDKGFLSSCPRFATSTTRQAWLWIANLDTWMGFPRLCLNVLIASIGIILVMYM